MAKCYAADVAMQVTTDAVQVMGGYGYSREYPVAKTLLKLPKLSVSVCRHSAFRVL